MHCVLRCHNFPPFTVVVKDKHKNPATCSVPSVIGFVNAKNFLYNKTNRLTNFQIYSAMKLYMFRAVPLPIIRRYPLYIRHWYVLYRSNDNLRAGSGWNCSSILILHASCLQNCITRASAECTVDNS